MFTLLCIALRLSDTFMGVSCASNVGYFFLWKPILKSVMFTLLCVALRLAVTRYLQGCLACSWKRQNLVYSALTFERLEQVKLVENKSLWDVAFEGRFGRIKKKSFTKTASSSFIQRSLNITHFENCTLLLSLVKSPMVNLAYLVARCNTIPFLVNLFQHF